MASTVGGMLIVVLLLATALMVWQTNLVGNTLLGKTTRESTALEGEQARTNISITTAVGDYITSNPLAVTVDNPGATSVAKADFSKMDVIVAYDGHVKAPLRLAYTTSSTPSAGEWTVTSISGQYKPDSWNPKETLTVHAVLPGTTCDPGTVTIGTPNGVIDSSPYICAGIDLTFHSEVSTIGATTYNQLKKDTPSDGAATTISSVFSAGLTGRVRPTTDSGKFVFPLTDVAGIPAADWEITYRLKRDKGDLGFV